MAGVGDLTSAHTVEQAIAEYDRIGRAAFLARYGFREARSYFLVHNGKRYDSKAIVGAAIGYQPLPRRRHRLHPKSLGIASCSGHCLNVGKKSYFRLNGANGA